MVSRSEGKTLIASFQTSYQIKNGVGIETDVAGSRYVGIWRDGLRHGSGRYIPSFSKIQEDRCYENGLLVSSKIVLILVEIEHSCRTSGGWQKRRMVFRSRDREED